MKRYFFITLIFCFYSNVMLFAQLDIHNPFVKFENIEDNTKPPDESLFPAFKTPSLSNFDDPDKNDKYENLGLEVPEEISISKEDNYVSVITNKTPKYFKEENNNSNLQEFSRDQYLGDVRVKAAFVNVVYRDYQAVDGDRVRIFLNEDVIKSNVFLGGSFQGFDLPLVEGFNKLDFQALNQGTSGPNTAELHIYDENGVLISAKQWNLTTGFKATFIIVKE
ncbi:MAG: hypothetical protein ACWA45_06120 [Flavobacteriales bacterium]